MEKPLTFTVQFNQADIISGQRLRYLNSGRIRLVFIVGLASLLYLAVQLLFPGVLALPDTGLTIPAGVAAIGLGTPLAAYLVAPYFDFRANPVWRQEFTVLAGADKITVRQAGQPAGYAMTWKSLTRLLENERVLVLVFGRETDFLIVPKAALGRADKVEKFKGLVRRNAPRLRFQAPRQRR